MISNLLSSPHSAFFRISTEFIRHVESAAVVQSEELAYTVLKGGRSGASLYQFSFKGTFYVLKLFASQTSPERRVHQLAIAEQAGKIGIGPEVLFIDSQGQGFVMEFIAGRTVSGSDFKREDLLIRFADFLRVLHHTQEVLPSACSPFLRFRNFLGQKGLNPSFLLRFAEIENAMKKIEALLERYPVSRVHTHLDLNSLNILLLEKRFVLVDWVNGGTQDPYFDLAMFAVFQDLDEKQARFFLEYYFGRDLTWEEWNRFVVVQPVRLFVIAAAFLPQEMLSIPDKATLPTFREFLRENALGVTRSLEETGAIMFYAGLELIEGDAFKCALHSLERAHREL